MHGTVVDHEGNPLAGISVSNGREVVTSDADGQFELDPVTPFYTVTRTAKFTTDQWWLPADANEIRFVMRPHAPTLPFEFVHLTDTHMLLPDIGMHEHKDFGREKEGSFPDEIEGFLASLHERAPEAQAVFITGDLVDNGLPDEFEAFTDAIASSPLPVHVIPGNHDHMNGLRDFSISRNNYFTNSGDTAHYEKYVGPRWYSFDIPGLHVVAMDWHSHELSIDHDLQNEWLAADLARIEPGSPWILLFHDQPGHSLLDHAPWHPIAAFSGHWHASRVVEVNGSLHVNSPTTFFANLDYSPPAFRRVTWDGERISLRTETVRTVPNPDPLGDVSTATIAPAASAWTNGAVKWSATLNGAGHRQQVTADGDLLFVGSQIEDEPNGFVEAIDAETGAARWVRMLSSAVKTAPVVWNDTVVAAEVSGTVHGLDRATGEICWTVESSDPYRRFGWNAPVIVDGVIYLGDQADIRAIAADTGEVIWRRTDVGPHHNLISHAQPLIAGDLLIMGFWPSPDYPVGLNRVTGETVWAPGAEVVGEFQELKRVLVMGTAAYDMDRDAVVMPAFASTVCVDRQTGAPRWAVEHEGAFSPAAPIVTPAGYLVTVTGHGIRMIDPDTGATIWDREVSGNAPFPMRSYSKQPHPVIARPTLVDDQIILPGLDGMIRVYGLDGELRGSLQLGSPLAAALTPIEDDLVGIGTDGTVFRLSVTSLLPGESGLAGAGEAHEGPAE